jgi:hypothetical protein
LFQPGKFIISTQRTRPQNEFSGTNQRTPIETTSTPIPSVEQKSNATDEGYIKENAQIIERTFEECGIPAVLWGTGSGRR